MAYNYTTNTRSDLTSNLHYIGARYVPAWYEDSNEGGYQWDSDTAYPALIIVKYSVTDSDGIEEPHYYISKKPVPNTVGTPPENATYWADLGVSSEYLNNRINKVIEDAEKEAETRQAQINEVNSKVDAETADREDGDKQLQENIDNAVKNLQAQLTAVKESAVTDVSMTNEDGIYSFTKTINGTSSDVGTVNVKEDNCVVELADNVVETTEGNYQNDYHNLIETTQDGTQNTIEQFRIARNQITGIEKTDGGLNVYSVDQNGNESISNLTSENSWNFYTINKDLSLSPQFTPLGNNLYGISVSYLLDKSYLSVDFSDRNIYITGNSYVSAGYEIKNDQDSEISYEIFSQPYVSIGQVYTISAYKGLRINVSSILYIPETPTAIVMVIYELGIVTYIQ